MKMIDEALRYAKAGIPVFPLHWLKQDGTCSCRLGDMCQAKGKHPRIKNWGEEATTDIAKITGWWNKTPLANIGIPMGEKSGLVALDVDTRHNGDTFMDQIMQSTSLTKVDGTTMKMLVEKIIARDTGIEVIFKCGVSVEHEYVK